MKAQELFEKAKKIAYEKQVPTDDILNPMLKFVIHHLLRRIFGIVFCQV